MVRSFVGGLELIVSLLKSGETEVSISFLMDFIVPSFIENQNLFL